MKLMLRALELAGRADPWPNPRVGAVVVQGDRIVGEGYHKRDGGPHAEVVALRQAGRLARGADLYVTLEPCRDFPGKRTPPCIDRIKRSGIRRVFVAAKDPAHGGASKLDIEVHTGILEEQARAQNRTFFKLHEEGLPYVVCKWAMTLDGKIATRTGNSKWISSPAARAFGRTFRRDTVVVGINTVLADNLELKGVRRLVLDSMARTPLAAKIARSGKTIIAASTSAPPARVRALRKKCEVHLFEVMDLADILRRMTQFGVRHVLIEGGGEVHASAFQAGLVDEALVFVAPKIVGGRDARTPVEGTGVATMAQALTFRRVEVKQVGSEAWIRCVR